MNVLLEYWHWFVASATVMTLLGYGWLVAEAGDDVFVHAYGKRAKETRR
ncbi:MAG: hypothetical protein PHP86_09985 [Nevskiales bacterium]|nr:hypothetical protein [Nevskiales bacterium]